MVIGAENLQAVVTSAGICAPLVTGLTEVVKRALGVPSKWLPLVAVVLGAIAGFFVIANDILGIVAGIIIGLSSVGLFELGRKTIGSESAA